MRSIPANIQTDLDNGQVTLASFLKVIRLDGQVFGLTDHDKDVVIDSVNYKSVNGITPTSLTEIMNLAVDNLDIAGVYGTDITTDFVIADTIAGLYDKAFFLLFVADWETPSNGIIVWKTGKLGQVEQNNLINFITELRGLTQGLLTKNMVEVYQPQDRARLFDTRNKLSRVDWELQAKVSAVTNNTTFDLAAIETETFNATNNFFSANGTFNQAEQSNIFDSVEYLTNFNGTQGQKSTDDLSNNNYTTTFINNVQLVTTDKQFGTASVDIPGGNGHYLTVPASTSWDFGTADFTAEAWVNIDSTSSFASIFGRHKFNTSARWNLAVNTSGILQFWHSLSLRVTTSTDLRTTGWAHVAVSRNSGTTRLFVNGVEEGSTATVSNITASAEPLHIGRDPESVTRILNGRIDDARITKGVGRYPAAFTPPIAELVPDIPGIFLLSGQTTGDWTSNTIDLSRLGSAGLASGIISWVENQTPSSTITVETAFDGSTFAPQTNGGAIDNVPVGTDADTVDFRIKVTVARTDTDEDPNVESVTFNLETQAGEIFSVDDFYKFGELTWTSGNNFRTSTTANKFYRREIQAQIGDAFTMFTAMNFDVAVDDTCLIAAGYDASLAQSPDKFNNINNFRGEPFIPNPERIIRRPQ